MRLERRHWWMLLAVLVGLFLMSGLGDAAGQVEPDENQVEFWCETGIKLEPVDTPFVVPDPPEGNTTWTLLVLKAGTENDPIPNPIPGNSYTHSNGKEISHAILCYEQNGTGSTTTSTTAPTSTSTTTTDPATTTSSSTSTTATPTTTTLNSSTTSTPTDTDPPTTPIPKGVETGRGAPEGGVAAGGGAMAENDDTFWGWMMGLGIFLAITLGFLAASDAIKEWWDKWKEPR